MSTETNASIIAMNLFTAGDFCREIMVSTDVDGQEKFSVRIGDIGNRVCGIDNTTANKIVYELEQRIKGRGMRPEINWTAKGSPLKRYNEFKRNNFLK